MRRVMATLVVLCLAVVLVPAQATLPARLADAEFWKLAADISEPGGYFRITDNYTSNEGEVGQIMTQIMTMMRERNIGGGVYLGVGPEQNFSYISAVQPSMAFILDIRRQAAMQHLMFKAMFELSKDRADFISLLFAKPRPTGLDTAAPIQKIWETYLGIATDLELASKTRARVIAHLTKTHGFALPAEEIALVESVMSAFVQFGPGITTRGSFGRGGGGNNLSFADLTGWAVDATGRPQSFLATDLQFQVVKALHDKNLIVPVTGDFGGPKALRAIGAYLRERGAAVSAFYVSNVEQYLFQDGKQQLFFDNVAALPLTETSVFIRPYAMRRYGTGPSLCGISRFLKTVAAARITTYNEALACGE